MIQISRYVREELIITDLRARSKEDAIRELIERLFAALPSSAAAVSSEEAFREVMAREKLQTTGLGGKIAFPHARIAAWGEFAVVMGISRGGIDFSSLDGLPAHFICLMISSADEPYIILQTMAAIVRFMRENKSAAAFFEGLTPREIVAEFTGHRIQTTKTIMARDIMRPVRASVRMDCSIEEVARLMHLKHLDVIPVVDERGFFCGEISCFHIFSYGLPDFFSQLHTISFLRYLDPFEKYYKMKRVLTVKDILKGAKSAIPQDTTLMEIIFQLTIKNRPKLFVVDRGRLVGELDRFSIIDKILFF